MPSAGSESGPASSGLGRILPELGEKYRPPLMTSTPQREKSLSVDSSDPDGSAFFDSSSGRWIRLNNFSFDDEENYFVKKRSEEEEAEREEVSPVAQVASSECSSVLDASVLAVEDNQFSVAAAEQKDFERIFKAEVLKDENPATAKPKIVSTSPRESAERSGTMKKVSDGLGSDVLPSIERKNGSLYEKKPCKTSIPRYVRRGKVEKTAMAAHETSPVEVVRQRSHSMSGLNRRLSRDCRVNSKSDGSLNRVVVLGPDRYKHVTSKVREYILQEMKNEEKPPAKLEKHKSKSLSSLSKEATESRDNLSRMKAFLSSSYLEQMQITLSKHGEVEGIMKADSVDRFDRSRISRLLDNLSEDSGADGDDLSVTVDVTDVLALAIEERREKREAERVLGQLQQNYDDLQRKYAEAENKIDKLRFMGKGPTVAADTTTPALSSPLHMDHTSDSAYASNSLAPRSLVITPISAKTAGNRDSSVRSPMGGVNSAISDALYLQKVTEEVKNEDTRTSHLIATSITGRDPSDYYVIVPGITVGGADDDREATKDEEFNKKTACPLEAPEDLPDRRKSLETSKMPKWASKERIYLEEQRGSITSFITPQLASRSATQQGIRTREAMKRLRDIEEQLNGLDCVADLTPEEKEMALDELKRAFTTLLQSTSDDQFEDDSLSSNPALDPDFIALLRDVGEKLQNLSLPAEVVAHHPEVIGQADSQIRADGRDVGLAKVKMVDPIEKVEKWQIEEEGVISLEATRAPQNNANSSCYGSMPTSPSPPAVIASNIAAPTLSEETPNAEPYDKASSPPAAEFDSGYPGSDRSVRYFSLKGISPKGNAEKQQRFLFNLEEEERSQSLRPNSPMADSTGSSSLPSDFYPSVMAKKKIHRRMDVESDCQKKALLRPPPALHRIHQHSVTDLSSDERSMFEQQQQNLSENPGVSPASTPSGHKESKCSRRRRRDKVVQDEVVASAPSSARQPSVLAKQIDQEILELRNFFDDHREEMMSLINETSKALPPVWKVESKSTTKSKVNPRNPVHGSDPNCNSSYTYSAAAPTTTSSSRTCSAPISNIMYSADSGTDVCEFRRERRGEFEERRKKMARLKRKAIYHKGGAISQKEVSQSDVFLGDEQNKDYGPDFMLGASANATKKGIISSLFPRMDQGDGGAQVAVEDTNFVNGGRVFDGPEGSVFVPKLNLEALTDDDRSRDPRSFDFNQSLPEEDGNNSGQGDAVAPGSKHKTIIYVRDSTSQTSTERRKSYTDKRGPEVSNLNSFSNFSSDGGVSVRSEVVIRGKSPNPLGKLAPNRRVKSACDLTPRPPPPEQQQQQQQQQSQPQQQQSPVVIFQTCCGDCKKSVSVRVDERSPEDPARKASSCFSFGRSGSLKSKKRKAKTKKELQALLSSLEKANQLASNLRERSKEIVSILGQEIQEEQEKLGQNV